MPPAGCGVKLVSLGRIREAVRLGGPVLDSSLCELSETCLPTGHRQDERIPGNAPIGVWWVGKKEMIYPSFVYMLFLYLDRLIDWMRIAMMDESTAVRPSFVNDIESIDSSFCYRLR